MNLKKIYKDSTYELVSKIAYLIGVSVQIFRNEYEPPKAEIYEQLERDLLLSRRYSCRKRSEY